MLPLALSSKGMRGPSSVRILGDQITPRDDPAVQLHSVTVTAAILQETNTTIVKSALAIEALPGTTSIVLVRDPGIQIAVAPGLPGGDLDRCSLWLAKIL